MKYNTLIFLQVVILILTMSCSTGIDEDDDDDDDPPTKIITEYNEVAPSNFRQTGKSINSISLSWEPVPGALKYRISKKSNSGDDFIELSPDTGSTAYTDETDLTSDSTHLYKIKGIFAGSPGPESRELVCHTAIPNATEIRKGLVTGHSIEIKWKEVDEEFGVNQYQIFRQSSADEEPGYRLIATITAGSEPYYQNPSYTYTDSNNIYEGYEYRYKIMAVNDKTDSGLSQPLEILMTLGVPDFVNVLETVDAAEDNSGFNEYFTFYWSNVIDAGGYKVYEYESLGSVAYAVNQKKPVDGTEIGPPEANSTMFHYRKGPYNAETAGRRSYFLVTALKNGLPGAVSKPVEAISPPWRPAITDYKEWNNNSRLRMWWNFNSPAVADGIHIYTIEGLDKIAELNRKENEEENIPNNYYKTNISELNDELTGETISYKYNMYLTDFQYRKKYKADFNQIITLPINAAEYDIITSLKPNEFYMIYAASYVNYSQDSMFNKSFRNGLFTESSGEDIDDIGGIHKSKQLVKVWTKPLPVTTVTGRLDGRNRQKIIFTWTDPNNEGENNQYGHNFIYSLTLKKGDDVIDQITDRTSLTYEKSETAPFSNYTLQVRVKNEDTGKESVVKEGVISTGLNVDVKTGYDTVFLSWSEVSGSNKYRITRYKTGFPDETEQFSTSERFLKDVISDPGDLKPAVNYTYIITALDDEVEIGTETITATTKSLDPPIIDVESLVTEVESLKLHWHDISDDIYLAGDNRVEFKVSVTWNEGAKEPITGIAGTETEIENLNVSTNYTITVETAYKGQTSGSNTDNSNSIQIKLADYLGKPVKQKADIDNFNITITWNKVPKANRYIIYRAKKSNNEAPVEGDYSFLETIDINPDPNSIPEYNHNTVNARNKQFWYYIVAEYDITIPVPGTYETRGGNFYINIPGS